MSLFPTLKDEKQWDAWQRGTIAQARAQDLEQVLDSDYTPEEGNEDEKNLFIMKQKFMYAVFECSLLTDQGKALVRAHEDDFDAQVIYRDLVAYALKSMKAAINSADILAYVTSAKFGDGSWRGSASSFILHWQDQVRLYEKQVELSEHFSPGQKRVMLQNAVHGLEEL